ncbi:c-type cytochrome [Telmatobacter bradus]|uniref:c-type cytochrome n=1 Tax=Telmatobacter bradus TaxID=474953 RepID=UPI003B42E383
MQKWMNRLMVGVLAGLIATPMFAQSSGADTYKAKCAMCHGVDGQANTPSGKAMKATPFSAKMPAAELASITKNGKGKMPAYANKLTSEQIDQVVAYIHTMQKK